MSGLLRTRKVGRWTDVWGENTEQELKAHGMELS